MTTPPTFKNRVLRPVLEYGPRFALGRLYAGLLERRFPGSPHVLALNDERFRGELEILSGQGVGVSTLPYDWQTRFLPYFSGRGVDLATWFHPIPGSEPAAMRARYRAVLRKLIPHLHERAGIEVVIGAAVHYLQDLDWGAAAQDEGVPYVVFHKENLVMSEGVREESIAFYERLGRFAGECLVVHNERMKSVFVDSGFAESDRVRMLGSARLDPFVALAMEPLPLSDAPSVVMFSFFHANGLMGMVRKDPDKFEGVWSKDGRTGFVDLFEQTHASVARFARDNPGIEVIIKTKWGGDWIDRVRAAAQSQEVDVDLLPNLTVTDRGDAQDLIARAHAVVGFGSTTLFEAAIAGRRVVVPHFAETTQEAYSRFVPFAEHLDIFDVAGSPNDLRRLLHEALSAPDVDPEVMSSRREAFELYVSPLEPAAPRWEALLREVAG